jgi:hypothetical protein
MSQNDVRREPRQFPRMSANGVGIGSGPAGVDPQVAADGPVGYHGKFIVTEELFKSNSTQSKILIAVSHDANPNHGWDFFSINSQY